MAEEDAELPFRGEYAKSGRSSCKMCKSNIGKGDLRLAAMVQSPMFDGKVPHWYHPKCFFTRNRPKAVGDISHYDSLRWEDQEKIQKMLDAALTGNIPSSSSGKGGKKGSSSGSSSGGGLSALGTILKDFRLEYAKSGQSKCGVCEENIKKGQVRAGRKEYDSQRAKMYGPYDKWHHIPCFVDKRHDLGYFDGGDAMGGFKTLSKEDQDMILDSLKPVKRKVEKVEPGDEPDSKKLKVDSKEKEALKKQMKKVYYYRDLLERNLKKGELQDLLESNGQQVPSGVDSMLDRLADNMMFGALKPCGECPDGQLVFRSGVGYQCLGNASEWTKCQVKTLDPPRKPFKVPQEFKEQYDFLALYKYKEGKRIVPNNPSTVKAEANGSSSATNEASIKKEPGTGSASAGQPLKNMTFVLEGKVDKDKLQDKIGSLGGKVEKKVGSKTTCVISTKDVMDQKKSKVIRAAEEFKIQVVSEDVLDNVRVEGIISQINKTTLSPWGEDPKVRLSLGEEIGKKSSSGFLKKDMPKSVKMKLKGGGFVDPDSGLEEKAHVLKIKDNMYSVVLGAVNIQQGKNSYYKLQILEHDRKPKWYVFRSWGRVGTTIGNNKLEDFSDRLDALRNFECLYEEKTGNRWSSRHNFTKVAGKFFPMDLDYGQDNEEIQRLELAGSKSKLDRAIQELMTLIFDIESMKKAMVEFEIDMTKMPLGKLSRKQINSAYKILTEVQDMIRNGDGSETKFLDASNRFFTLIPHDFGMKSPPLLDNPDYIKTKIDMLDNLLEIEVAYSLLKSEKDDEDCVGKDPIDAHYEKLKTEIGVVDKTSDEFKTLQRYVQNTHAATHNLYSLEIDQVFKINRKGEAKRFKPFKKLDNHMLLWHGSRTTNYAGILSQGLRIAPPEAPVTGYMFGKGVYFADMVSKSANYCNTTRSNNTGLLLLCDVALGNMYERNGADYIEKLPAGKHSTKGVGKTAPDPKDTVELEGVKVPVGKGVKQENVAKTDLLYNEYIVYDVAQIHCKYLLKLNFKYKL